MALRLLELFLPEADGHGVEEALAKERILGVWREPFSEGRVLVKVLLDAGDVEGVLDLLERRFGHAEDYQVILLPVEAVLPRPKPPEPEPKEETGAVPGAVDGSAAGLDDALPVEEEPRRKRSRISVEELYADIESGIRSPQVFIAMTLLSSVVAAVGLYSGNVAVIIGAMVIAPLLGPGVALSLATTLGDLHLARRAAMLGTLGIALTLVVGTLLGVVFPASPDLPEVAARTRVGLPDIALALASGGAGALSVTTAVPAALVGVMVAVALLPPLVVLGMMVGSGAYGAAMGAMLLVLVNLICINLSGVVTFLAQGVAPRTYWEADKARRATLTAVAMWTVLLVALGAAVTLARSGA